MYLQLGEGTGARHKVPMKIVAVLKNGGIRYEEWIPPLMIELAYLRSCTSLPAE